MISWFSRSRIRKYVSLSPRKQNKVRMGLEEQLAELQKQFETVSQHRESLTARLRVQEDRCKTLGDERHRVHEAYQEQVRSKLLLQGNVESKMETIKKLEERAEQMRRRQQ